MKKFIVLTLFGLLIMAFSATAYALEFKASGMIDFDTVLEENTPYFFGTVSAVHGRTTGSIFQSWITPSFVTTGPNIGKVAGAFDKSAAYAYSRALLKFDAVVSKELSGTIFFEMDALRWGAGPGGFLTQASERNTVGVWSTDRAAVEVKNIYIDAAVPGMPVPVKARVGAQPLSVRPRMVVYTDGVGVTGEIKADPVTIMPMWFKAFEGTDYASDDVDVYGLHLNAKVNTFTIGGYGLYYNMNSFPIIYPTGYSWGTVGSVSASTSASYGLYVAGTQKADFWWLGVYADGKAGPVDLNFDFVYDTGKVKSPLTPTVDDVKYSGWATRLRVDYPWEKFNFGVVGMYASGADARKTSKTGLPGEAVADPVNATAASTRVRSYIVPPGSEAPPGANEAMVVYSSFNAVADGGTGIASTGNYYGVSRGAFGGTWFAKLYGSYKLTPWFKSTLQGLYIGDTTKNGNTFGTARQDPTSASSALKDDKSIGWEFDLINEIDIYKNLKFFVGGGYLWAGKAMDVYNAYTTTPSNFSPNNPWVISTRLMYTF